MGRVAFGYLVRAAIIFPVIVALAGLAQATTATIPSDDDMVVRARAIVTGQVLSVESAQVNGEYDIYTYVTLKVDSVLKGRIVSSTIVLKEPGGIVGQSVRRVFGTPQFSPGERVLVYLDTWWDGSLRAHQMFLGKFSIVTDPSSGKLFVSRTAPSSHVELVTGSPTGTATSWMEMRSYLKLVRTRLISKTEAARIFEEMYYHGSPILANPPEYAEKAFNGALQPQYHLFSPPARWFEPDSGQPVTYLLNPDQQPSSRTAADIDAAMNAWSTVSGCSLRVVDGGTTSQCDATGVGVVDFNNCKGLFSPGSSTGILAIGGYSYSAGGASTKVINGVTFGQIISGFISVNPNDRTDLADDAKVQEIVTHEMGHSLGLQHSWDPSFGGSPTAVEMDATMYYIAHFDGRAASLRSDDIAGITFVYPGGAGGGPPPLQITTASLPRATVGASYSTTLAATGGAAPYTWGLTASSGPLPGGLSLASNGVISGQPSSIGIFNFTVQVVDSTSMTAQVQLSIQVQSASTTLSISTTSLPHATVGLSYSVALAATGGTQPYSWTLATGSGPLPPGLGLSSGGAISGAPTSTGTYAFTVQVSDSASHTVTASLSITVDSQPSLTITTASLPQATIGVGYSVTLMATGGTQPYSWSLAAGSGLLPSGFSLSSAGVISGTASSTGTSNFVVQVSDGASHTAMAQLAITVDASGGAQFDSLFISQSVPTTLAPGQNFSVSMTWRNIGTSPWNEGLEVRIGSQNPENNTNWGSDRVSFQQYIIPAATQFTITIQNFVAPVTPGVYNFQWQMVQDNGVGFFGDVSANVSITVGNPSTALSIQTTSLSGAQVGKAFSQQLTAAGGTPPYTWSVTGMPLPAGLTLSSSTGVVSGTPAQAGSFILSVTVTDSASRTSQKAVGMTIEPPQLSISAPQFPSAVVGSAFNQQLTATGGIAPYTWSITSGALPVGLTLNAASGLISGSPTTTGKFAFNVAATDKEPTSTGIALQITVVTSGVTPQVTAVKYKLAVGKLIVRGQNFDSAAVVLLDGSTDGSQLPIKSRDVSDIVIKPINLVSGTHQVQVVNSNGASSTPVQFTVP